MSLFSPLWKTTDPKKLTKAIDEVNRTDDVYKLIRISEKAPNKEIKSAASKRLLEKARDPKKVKYILVNTESKELRREIISGIDDQDLLISLYTDGMDYSESALSRITDQSMLKDIVNNRRKGYRTAVRNITDQEFLEDIVRKDPNCDFGRIAFDAITDQDFLKEIANDRINPLRYKAMMKITDRKFIDTMIEESRERRKKYLKIGKLPDDSLGGVFFETDMILCTFVESSRLVYIDPVLCCELVYKEYTPQNTALTQRCFSNHLPLSGDGKTYRIEFPYAMVDITDRPMSDNELLICPRCSGVRKGNTEFLKRCNCGSQLHAVRLKYSDNRLYKR